MQQRGLTSFRALAFLAVFFFHSDISIDAGYLGIQAFFVLSGFLLTPILLDMKKNLNTREFFVNFYGRRALRIFPPYYLYLLVVLPLALGIISLKENGGIDEFAKFINQLPWALTYTYDFFQASILFKHTYFLAHFWSLAIEEQFYLVWPLILYLTKEKHLKHLLLMAVFMGPVLRFTTAIIATHSGILSDQIDLVVYVLPFSHIDAFAIGGYFALYRDAKSNVSTWLLVALTVLLGYSTEYASLGHINNITSFGYPHFMKDKFIWGYSVLNFIFAYILVQVKNKKFLPRLFEDPVLHYLGKISYGLYIYHYSLIWIMNRTMPDLPPVAILFLSLFASILISSIGYELFDKRFINLKDKFFPKETH